MRLLIGYLFICDVRDLKAKVTNYLSHLKTRRLLIKMAASGNRLLVNDYVEIDGSVISIVKPLGTYTMYNIQTNGVGRCQKVGGHTDT